MVFRRPGIAQRSSHRIHNHFFLFRDEIALANTDVGGVRWRFTGCKGDLSGGAPWKRAKPATSGQRASLQDELLIGRDGYAGPGRYLRLLNFRDRYHARSRLLDYLNSDGFDYWSDGLFYFLCGFLHTGARLGLAVAAVSDDALERAAPIIGGAAFVATLNFGTGVVANCGCPV